MTDTLIEPTTRSDADLADDFVEGPDGRYYSVDGAWWWDEDADDWALVEVIERDSILNREVPALVTYAVVLIALVLAGSAMWTGYRMHETNLRIACNTNTLNATLLHQPMPDC